jgi:hypothetical protein
MNLMGMMANLGWKTIAGAGLYAIGQILPVAAPELAPTAAYLSASGALLGGVGVAHKGATILAVIRDILDAVQALNLQANQPVQPSGANQAQPGGGQ